MARKAPKQCTFSGTVARAHWLRGISADQLQFRDILRSLVEHTSTPNPASTTPTLLFFPGPEAPLHRSRNLLRLGRYCPPRQPLMPPLRLPQKRSYRLRMSHSCLQLHLEAKSKPHRQHQFCQLTVQILYLKRLLPRTAPMPLQVHLFHLHRLHRLHQSEGQGDS